MWMRVLEMVKNGRAIMVYTAANEQGLAFEVHDHDWVPVDFEGITLMLRPAQPSENGQDRTQKTGWSDASKRSRYRRR
jgi:CRISPR-associated protein Cas2